MNKWHFIHISELFVGKTTGLLSLPKRMISFIDFYGDVIEVVFSPVADIDTTDEALRVNKNKVLFNSLCYYTDYE